MAEEVKETKSDGWFYLEDNAKTPPNELVEVKDANNRTAKARPTYYDFKVVKNKNNFGKWSSDVVPCDPYWDTGWIIHVVNALSIEIGTIIAWRPLKIKT